MDQLLQTKCSVKNPEDFLNLQIIEEALKVNISFKLRSLINKQTESKVSKKDFTNIHQGSAMVELANLHIRYVTFWLFKDKVLKGEIKCSGVRTNLQNLCMLYGLNLLQKNSTSCYESAYFSEGVAYSQLIHEAIKLMNKEIRPQAVSIMESFGYTDNFLQSAIGNSYGDIYETHLKWAKDSKLNKTKQGDAIPDGFMEYMMPILQAKM